MYNYTCENWDCAAYLKQVAPLKFAPGMRVQDDEGNKGTFIAPTCKKCKVQMGYIGPAQDEVTG